MTLKYLLASQYLRKRLKLRKIKNATADYANIKLRRLDSRNRDRLIVYFYLMIHTFNFVHLLNYFIHSL